MSSLKARQVHQGLLSKGFVLNNNDHRYFVFHIDGKKTSIRTRLSHGEKDIGNPLILAMARQTHLSKEEFIDLVECPLSEEEYIHILESKNILKHNNH